MRNRGPVGTLPDIDDSEYARRLQPLMHAVVPAEKQGASGGDVAGKPAILSAGVTENRNIGAPAVPLRPTRAPRRGVEFLLPEPVVVALKTEAAQRGTSMSVRVLEILRDAGYPVVDQDFTDLRKLPRR